MAVLWILTHPLRGAIHPQGVYEWSVDHPTTYTTLGSVEGSPYAAQQGDFVPLISCGREILLPAAIGTQLSRFASEAFSLKALRDLHIEMLQQVATISPHLWLRSVSLR